MWLVCVSCKKPWDNRQLLAEHYQDKKLDMSSMSNTSCKTFLLDNKLLEIKEEGVKKQPLAKKKMSYGHLDTMFSSHTGILKSLQATNG